MNALFDEQNNVVLERACDAILPVAIHESMMLHHENIDIQQLETLAQAVGGSTHGHIVAVIKEENNV